MHQPNILLITVDQWRADFFGYNGAAFAQTPHIDKLANTATVFRQHYAGAVPCGPSRCSLLTGLYPSNHRSVINGTPLDHTIPTFASLTRAAGYDPVLYGYTDTPPDPRTLQADDPRLLTYEGVMEGFRIGLNHNHETHEEWNAALQAEGFELNPNDPFSVWDRGPEPEGRAFDKRPARYTDAQSDTRFLADHIIEEIQQAEAPFCIHASFLRPHPPFQAPAPWHNLVNPDDVSEPIPCHASESHPYQALFDDFMARPGFVDPAMNLPAMTPDDTRHARAVYAGMGAEVDCHLGRIFDALKASGQYHNTLIIFTGDHGEMLGDHGNWGKLHWYDSCWHIPMIMKLPEQHQSSEVQAFTEAVDILPTILDAIKHPIPTNMNGHSLSELVSEEPTEWRDSVMLEFDFRDPVKQFPEKRLGLDSDHCNGAILRDQHYKYVHFTDLPPLLYDLTEDPQETRNLAGHPEYQTIQLNMASRLLSARLSANDRTQTNIALKPTGIVNNEHPRPKRRPLSTG